MQLIALTNMVACHVAPRCDVAMERFCAWLRRRLADFKASNHGVTVPHDRKNGRDKNDGFHDLMGITYDNLWYPA